MRMLIIALVAVLVLGGGGAGAYFYFTQEAEASSGAEEHEQELQNAKKEGHGESMFGGSEFVELGPLVLPIVDSNGVSQTVSMVVALEVKGSYEADKVRRYEPKLKDAFIQDMYGALNRHAALKGGVVQVGMIKQRLNKISDKVMGDDETVRDVLLQVVQQRPI